MPIYKTKTGYRVQNDMGKKTDGTRSRRSVSCKTLKEAEQLDRRMQAEKDGMGAFSSYITLSEFLDEVYLPMKAKTLRKNTLDGYKRDLKRIRPHLGKLRLKSISRLHVQTLLTSCPTYKVAKNTKDTLRAILSEAVQLDVLVRNPAAGSFQMPERITETKKTVDWVTSFPEHLRIIEAADRDDVERILVLGLCFGLRKGEILGLDWKGVDLKERVIRIYQTYTYSSVGHNLTPPKTRASIREIPISDLAFEYLSKWLEQDGDKIAYIDGRSRPVITYRTARMRPDMAQKRITAFFRLHPELPRVTCGSLRHSFATAAVLGGVNIASLSKWLGHADITTTLNRYVKPLQTDLKTEAERISKLYMARNGTPGLQKSC